MAILNIPDRYKLGFVALSKINDDELSELSAALSSATAAFATPAQLSFWASQQVKKIDEVTCRNIVEALASLYRVRQKPSVSTGSLAMDLSASALEKIPGFSATQAETLGFRLRLLLELKSLNLTGAKAKELQLEAERIFCDARVVTDIRPVFGKDGSSDPSSAIVVHTLKIGFHDSRSAAHKEIYIALDSADITSLKTALERAGEKESSLKKLLSRAGLHNTDLAE